MKNVNRVILVFMNVRMECRSQRGEIQEAGEMSKFQEV